MLEHKVVSIIRGADPEQLVSIVRALHAGGVRAVEVTINSPKALAGIEKLTAELGSRMLIGAGTVLDPETARAALLAGARFIISPTLSAKTIRMTKRYGAISIPGAFTPTEILTAYEHGGDIIKVFPATLGPGYLRDLAGPLPHIPLMPTGGVTLDNISALRQAGAVAFGVGSALVDTRQPATPEYLAVLTDKARQFVQAVSASA
ncbi:bifunctional 4-hydroxy-2-oxoglutarate aldolase/2-dehydro-3-deoxy-phosphogluconate aldolase [Hymenobacter algoricola]|uniref:Bifunctional 4-hydroxy-2-oxoglutarate aldolase/2-dehydro-3-deoxy-phosphogluconate aldolase n=1 Tax=Hymenobacter algoricola TaxID=486267 RepID=A0ABP7MQG3_9BACT